MKRAGKVFDDILAAFLITFSVAVFSYEGYVPENVIDPLRSVVFIAFILYWIVVSVKNGIRESIAFPILAALFWILPLIVIYLSNNGPEFIRMSIVFYVMSEFFNLLINTPLEMIAKLAGITRIGALSVLLLILAAAYFYGMLIADVKEEKDGSFPNTGFLSRFMR